MESPEQPTRDEKEALRLARGLDNEAEVEAYTPRLQSLLRVPRPPIQNEKPRPKTGLGANEKKGRDRRTAPEVAQNESNNFDSAGSARAWEVFLLRGGFRK